MRMTYYITINIYVRRLAVHLHKLETWFHKACIQFTKYSYETSAVVYTESVLAASTIAVTFFVANKLCAPVPVCILIPLKSFAYDTLLETMKVVCCLFAAIFVIQPQLLTKCLARCAMFLYRMPQPVFREGTLCQQHL